MAGKIVADQIQGTTTTETVNGSSVTIPNVIDTKYVVNGTAKAWANVDASAGVNDSFNISSTADTSTLINTFTLINAFLNDSYVALGGSAAATGAYTNTPVTGTALTTSSYTTYSFNVNTGGAIEAAKNTSIAHGDLA